MSWVRVDDGFADHPKMLELTPAERWTWIRALCYCARYRTDGVLTTAARARIGVDARLTRRLLGLGLADNSPDPELDYAEKNARFSGEKGAVFVHDWREYSPKDPTAAERKRRQRAKGDPGQRDKDRDSNRDITVTRAQERAGDTVQSRPKDDDDERHELERLSVAAGWTLAQRRGGLEDPARAVAWLRASSSADRPAAFAWSGFAGGGWPDGTAAASVDVARAASAWLESQAWDDSFDELAIAEELERIARRASVAGELDMAGALAYWRELRADRYPNGGNDGGT